MEPQEVGNFHDPRRPDPPPRRAALTQLFQVESFMTIEEGGSKNYSESQRMSELAVIDTTDPQTDLVVAIPQPILQHRKEVSTKSLPFKIKVDSFYDHSI